VSGTLWRAERWDSFCLVAPNWQCQLPGFPYQGLDPHAFTLRDEIVAYIDAFVASFAPPLLEGSAVRHLRACLKAWSFTGDSSTSGVIA